MNKAKEKSEWIKNWNWPLILGVIGALSWLPYVIEIFSPTEIHGKLISIYGNVGTSRNTEATLFLTKIAFFTKNRNYNVRDIELRIRFEKSGWKRAVITNQRSTIFTFPDGPRKLNLKNEDFLNNLIVFPKDSPVVGYINSYIPGSVDERILEVEIILNSFKGENKKLILQSPPIEQMLFDDSIWLAS